MLFTSSMRPRWYRSGITLNIIFLPANWMTSHMSDWLPTDGPIQTRSSLYGVFFIFRVCLHLTSTFILIPGDWTISLNYLFLCNYVARNAHDRQAGLNIALCIDFWLIVNCYQRVAFLVSYMTMINHYYHWYPMTFLILWHIHLLLSENCL